MPDSSFIFTLCQVGAEPALKQEMASRYPEFRFAFSRPGYVTFKKAKGQVTPDLELQLVFARAYGVSLGRIQAEPVQKILDLAESLKTQAGTLRLHVFERDHYFPGDEPPGFVPSAQAKQARQRIAEDPGLQALLRTEERPLPGDLVIDVAVIETDEWWLGYHQHSPAHSPFPGGKPELHLPPQAPSRAYLKLKDALLWSGAPMHEGDVAVEIGSAPGGASLALLEKGLKVVGIDPAQMDRRILGHPGFWHVAKSFAYLEARDLPKEVQWLLLDMNASPDVSLGAVEHVASFFGDSLLGMMLTLKLNQWTLAAQIPHWLEFLKGLGLSRVRATQLSTNRQEIAVYGLTRKGVLRATSKARR